MGYSTTVLFGFSREIFSKFLIKWKIKHTVAFYWWYSYTYILPAAAYKICRKYQSALHKWETNKILTVYHFQQRRSTLSRAFCYCHTFHMKFVYNVQQVEVCLDSQGEELSFLEKIISLFLSYRLKMSNDIFS